MNEQALAEAVAKLDAWFESMRCSGGYGGPVAHWWRDSLLYTGPGLDWRYEGIIIGYLNLYEKTREQRWLRTAMRAGDDLVQGQLPRGNFKYSSFEANPKSGGTPHEAAACVALLSLAKVLKKAGNQGYRKYLAAAKRNIEEYYIKRLWDQENKMFRDSVHYSTFVPNKSATLVEALFLLGELLSDDEIVKKYAIPTVELIIRHQSDNSKFSGAIYQMSVLEGKKFKFTPKFFPFYISRCVPALLQAAEFTGNERYLNSAKTAVDFIFNTSYGNGSFPQVLYLNGGVARNPQWVAGVGDILRAFHSVSQHEKRINVEKPVKWLLSGLDECGGIRTAHGFAVQTSSEEYSGPPDFKDLLHVCGWNDKAFRFLTEILPENSDIPTPEIKEFEAQCTFKNREVTFFEDAKGICLKVGGQEIYKWRKGEAWAEMDIKYLM